MTTHELAPNPSDDYMQSVQRLFILLDTSPTEAQQRYFTVDWDETEPAKITEVTLMTAEPTGARRQERWGQFHSAQFLFTEVTDAGDTSQRYAWCPTGPSQTGIPIGLDVQGLTESHGYEQFSHENIVHRLTERARSVDDHIILTRLMQQHEIEPVPNLVESVNRLIYLFVRGRPDPSKGASDTIDRDKMFSLVAQFQALGTDMPKAAPGRLITLLIREISHGGDSADYAASTLELAIKQGIIPDERRLVNRIFSDRLVYAYPFATEMLHAKLQAEPNYGTPTHIFGEKRIIFAINYIAATLRQDVIQLDSHLYRIVRQKETSSKPERLYSLLNNLIFFINSNSSEAYPETQGLAQAGPAFAYILSRLARRESDTIEDRADFDRKRVEIIEKVLAPVLRKQIGKLAIPTDRPGDNS